MRIALISQRTTTEAHQESTGFLSYPASEENKMTAQAMNILTYRDLEWCICEMNESEEILPSNDDLGICCESLSSANLRGRIHYLKIDRQNRLKLDKIYVNLKRGFEKYVPEMGYREEIVQIRRARGKTDVYEEKKSVFLGFDNLRVNYTGEIVLGRQLDPKLYQHIGWQSANRFFHRIILQLKEGIVIPDLTQEEKGSHPDT